MRKTYQKLCFDNYVDKLIKKRMKKINQKN